MVTVASDVPDALSRGQCERKGQTGQTHVTIHHASTDIHPTVKAANFLCLSGAKI